MAVTIRELASPGMSRQFPEVFVYLLYQTVY